MKNLFVFDCESTSLHGSTFAVGCIVTDHKGVEVDRFEMLSLEGKEKISDWVKQNVMPNLADMPTCETDLELRNKFFEFYMKHKETCEIWSDCNYPVETNFLASVVADDIAKREWSMPYPLRDISTILDINIDRCKIYEEKTGKKLRKHNPTDDSIASLFCLIKKKLLIMNNSFSITWVQNEKEDFIFHGYIGKVKTSLQLEVYSDNYAIVYNTPMEFVRRECIALNTHSGDITMLSCEKFEGTPEYCKNKAYDFFN